MFFSPCRYPASSPKSWRASASSCTTSVSLPSTSQFQCAECSSKHCSATKRLRIQPGRFTDQPATPCHAHATWCHADAPSAWDSCCLHRHQSGQQSPQPSPPSHHRKTRKHHLCRSCRRQPDSRCRCRRGYHLCQTSNYQSQGRGDPLCAHSAEGA